MKEYKQNSIIKRIKDDYYQVKEGEIYTIKNIYGDEVYLKEVEGKYDINNFELVEQKQELIFESL